jgi:FtsP/CotA-like multicopper oxidase with cupredoxin domain
MSRRSDTDSYQGAFFGVASVLLGLLVAVLGFAALLMWIDARNARHDVHPAGQSLPATAGSQMGNGGLTSYAGAAPANADALAAAHTPYPAALPAASAGSVANVNLVLTDLTVEIAPGVKYAAWAWAGGAPGPVIHVRQGQLVKITLTNKGAIPHSVDSTRRVSPRTRRSAM